MFRSAHLDEGAAQAFQQGVARGLFVHTFDSLPVGLGFGGMGLSQAVEGLSGLQMAANVLGDLFAPAAHGATRDFRLLAPAIFGSLPARFEARLAADFGNLFVGFIFGEPGALCLPPGPCRFPWQRRRGACRAGDGASTTAAHCHRRDS